VHTSENVIVIQIDTGTGTGINKRSQTYIKEAQPALYLWVLLSFVTTAAKHNTPMQRPKSQNTHNIADTLCICLVTY